MHHLVQSTELCVPEIPNRIMNPEFIHHVFASPGYWSNPGIRSRDQPP
jgi:hypothetical protein